jgi:hypothetical protein
VLLRLLGVLLGQGPKADVDALDDLVIGLQVQAPCARRARRSRAATRTRSGPPWADARGPERLVDLALRSGPYGDQFGAKPDGLTLDARRRRAARHRPRRARAAHPRGAAHAERKIELAPEIVIADLAPARGHARPPAPGLLLVGRRHVRSNNSWMHNLPMLAKGPARCTLQLHPHDAAARGLAAGELARVSSRVGSVRRRSRSPTGSRRRGQPAARLGPRRAGHARSVSRRSGPAPTATCSPTSSRSTRSRARRC